VDLHDEPGTLVAGAGCPVPVYSVTLLAQKLDARTLICYNPLACEI
jgi:hypothetical protein